MKKFLIIVCIILLLYGTFLVTPVGLFFYQLSSLEFSADIFPEEFQTLAALSIVEQSGAGNTENKSRNIMLILTEEDVTPILHNAFRKKEGSFMKVRQVDINISPETIHVVLSSQYGLFGYQFFYTMVISEWMVRVYPESSPAGHIEIKPLDIHTNHLYTVNWAKIWDTVMKTDRTDGWLALPSSSRVRIYELTLKEHEVFIHVKP